MDDRLLPVDPNAKTSLLLFACARSESDIIEPFPSRPFARRSLLAPLDGAFGNSRGQREGEGKGGGGSEGGGGAGSGDLRNYGRWKTGDLPGDRHLGRRTRYTVSRYTRGWRDRREDESFYVRARSHECLGTICPDNIATGTLFTYNEMRIVAPLPPPLSPLLLFFNLSRAGRERVGRTAK